MSIHIPPLASFRRALAAAGLAALLAPTAALAQAGTTPLWHRAEHLGFGQCLYDVAHHGDLWVAVGCDGVIRTSPDGTAWTERPSGTRNRLRALAWGTPGWVAVGHHGTVVTSPDGLTWTARTCGLDIPLREVIWAGSRFVAAGAAGGEASYTLTSEDGITWSALQLPPYKIVNALCWTGSLVVAVGSDNGYDLILTAADGISWEQSDAGSDYLVGIAWSGERLVAVSGLYGGPLWTSTDGITWLPIWLDAVTTDAWSQIFWTGSRFLAAGVRQLDSTREDAVAITSGNGLDWTDATFPLRRGLGSVAGVDPFEVAVGGGGAIAVSSESGARWNTVDEGFNTNLRGVTYDGERFVAVGSEGLIVTSRDGRSWEYHPTEPSMSLTAVAAGLVDGEPGLVAVSAGYGGIVSTTDSSNWTVRRNNVDERLQDVAWTGSRWVAVGLNRLVLTSPDGITWTQGTFDPAAPYMYGPYVACAADGEVVAAGGVGAAVSSDGWSWSGSNLDDPYNPDGAAFIYGLAWGNGSWLGVGSNHNAGGGVAYTSSDGSTWALSALVRDMDLRAATWDGERFVAVGPCDTKTGSAILGSPDGVSWSEELTCPWYEPESFYAVATGADAVVAVGSNGVIRYRARTTLFADGFEEGGTATWAMTNP